MTPLDDLEIEMDDFPVATKITQRPFQPAIDLLKKDNLKGCQATHLNAVSKLSSETKKTKSIGAFLLSWAVNTKASIWATVSVFKSIRFWMLLGTPSQLTRSQVDKNLNELTGSIHLAKAIHALSPKVAAWVQEKLIALKLHESLNAFLKEEHCTLHTFVDVLLPVIYANIAKNIRDCTNGIEHQQPVTLADVTSYICEMINRHLPYITQRLEAIEKAPEGEKRERLICHVFSHVVDEFLTTALPNGVNELPLIKVPILSQHFWKIIQKKVLPVVFYETYRQFSAPMRESQKLKLLEKQGGESLVSLAQMAGDKETELFPMILADAVTESKDGDVTTMQESPLVASITKYFISVLNGSEELKNWLSGWFIKELILFGKSDSKDLMQLWSLLGGYLEPMLIHIFVNMSQVEGPLDATKGRMPDAMGIILIRFLSVCSRFFNGNSQKIQERIVHLKMNNENFHEDEALLKIFAPLADELLSLMGLNTETTKLPLPDFLKETVVHYLKEIAFTFIRSKKTRRFFYSN